jgi:hypothetical protein
MNLTGCMGRFDTVGSPLFVSARVETARWVSLPFGVSECEASVLSRVHLGTKELLDDDMLVTFRCGVVRL